jgi:hypothetical protein
MNCRARRRAEAQQRAQKRRRSELQADLFPLDAAAAKATRERSSGRGTHGRAWCSLCRVDTLEIGEFYMLKDEVWDAAVGADNFIFYLCIGCLELRLGRRLMPSDFTNVPTNEIHGGKSPRLRDRMAAR